jgi:peptide/nickel transport system substrate-binding protein
MALVTRGVAAATLLVAGALALSACGGDDDSGSTSGGSTAGSTAAGTPKAGGTLYFLSDADGFEHLDPQRNYTGEQLAFMSGYVQRTLTSYKFAKGEAGNDLIGDLATDTGTPTDGAKTWSFTLRDGVSFQDGSPITCADIKYGVSRTFATDTITDGPTYAISDLDIPTDADGNSVYKGPYTTAANDTAAFDKAVTCSADNKTITFHLSSPKGDFNYTTTLLSFSPVPKSADTNPEAYDSKPVSSGPYEIQSYTKTSKMVLVRNPNWKKSSDGYRGAYPDKIEVDFGIDPKTEDQRLMADEENDKFALSTSTTGFDPSDASAVFSNDQYKDRRFDGNTVFVRYYAINAKKVPLLKQRQAIMVALDRAALRTNGGGKYAGDLADSVVSPLIGADYKATGLWDTLLGKKIPDSGDPEYAKQLIAESGAPMVPITFDYNQSPTNDKAAGIVVESLGKAGIKVTPKPIEQSQYYPTVQDESKADELMNSGWGQDWPNASTVIPSLFAKGGGFNISYSDDADFNAKVAAASAETDPAKQAAEWQDLTVTALKNGWAIPRQFDRAQRIVGSSVGGAYFWSPYGSWPYGQLYVK